LGRPGVDEGGPGTPGGGPAPAADGAAQTTATTIAKITLRRKMATLFICPSFLIHGSFRQAAKAKPGKNGLLGWNPSASYQSVIKWLIGAAIIPSMVTLHSTPVHWAFTASPGTLDPARYLGELAELPPTPQPGDWCTIAVVDELGEIRCTFVAVEGERSSSLFVDRRGEAVSPALPVGRRAQPVHRRASGRVAEWDGTDGTAGPPRKEEGGAAD
jgi:hypothetical protein